MDEMDRATREPFCSSKVTGHGVSIAHVCVRCGIQRMGHLDPFVQPANIFYCGFSTATLSHRSECIGFASKQAPKKHSLTRFGRASGNVWLGCSRGRIRSGIWGRDTCMLRVIWYRDVRRSRSVEEMGVH